MPDVGSTAPVAAAHQAPARGCRMRLSACLATAASNAARAARASCHCKRAQGEDCNANATDCPAQDAQRLAFVQHGVQPSRDRCPDEPWSRERPRWFNFCLGGGPNFSRQRCPGIPLRSMRATAAAQHTAVMPRARSSRGKLQRQPQISAVMPRASGASSKHRDVRGALDHPLARVMTPRTWPFRG